MYVRVCMNVCIFVCTKFSMYVRVCMYVCMYVCPLSNLQYIVQAAGSIDFPCIDSAKWHFSAEVPGLVAAEVDQGATLDEDEL